MSAVDLVAELRQERQLPTPKVRRLIRETAGLSLERLAKQLGVHRRSLQRWELGTRTPRGDLCRRYVELLNALREMQ